MEGLKSRVRARVTSHPALYLCLGSVLVFCLIIGIGFLLTEYYSQKISGEITRELLGKCGQIALESEKQNGVVSGELMAFCWAGEAGGEALSKGAEMLAPYGYSLLMDEKCNPYYRPIKKQLIMGFLTFALGAAAVIFLLGLAVISAVNRQIIELTAAAEKILEEEKGKFPQKLSGAMGRHTMVLRQYADRTKKLLAALAEEKNRMKDFLSDISHQMKTPAAVLKLNHELMLSDLEMNPLEREDFLRRDMVQLERMSWLLSGLLKLARLEAEAVEYNIKPHSLFITVECVFDSFRQTAKQKGVRLVNCLPRDMIFSYDEDWMQEAIGNLVKNALEHCREEGGEILCRGSFTPMTAEFSILDNGQGISKEELPHIFERFYSRKTEVNSAGVGIGLSLAAKIFEAFEGKIRTASDSMGTTFTVSFLTKM